ncbi:unnamed protein product [Paramecium octaurelia]|uniref:Uncharacterized protein n=1 Tax=Paramecium octaurelia TaxID=43137 RepID=A0A8S1VYH0_PAROT|nr:unnamed protein product [Paramecium octaurelia]
MILTNFGIGLGKKKISSSKGTQIPAKTTKYSFAYKYSKILNSQFILISISLKVIRNRTQFCSLIPYGISLKKIKQQQKKDSSMKLHWKTFIYKQTLYLQIYIAQIVNQLNQAKINSILNQKALKLTGQFTTLSMHNYYYVLLLMKMSKAK